MKPDSFSEKNPTLDQTNNVNIKHLHNVSNKFFKVLLTLQIFYFFFSLDYDFKLSTLSKNFI